ncbi:hypothetical protein LINPERHAP2_LOCUS14746 [Linum perenne]
MCRHINHNLWPSLNPASVVLRVVLSEINWVFSSPMLLRLRVSVAGFGYFGTIPRFLSGPRPLPINLSTPAWNGILGSAVIFLSCMLHRILTADGSYGGTSCKFRSLCRWLG